MTYNSDDIQTLLSQKGEITVVLESGVEYELHIHDTTFDNGVVTTEGMIGGEYVHSQFPAERVEHATWHKES